MSRQRLTARNDAEIIAEIDALEKMVEAGMDEELVQDAQGTANEDAKVTGEPAVDVDGQNEKANDNWPMSASERHALATRLVAMAKRLMSE